MSVNNVVSQIQFSEWLQKSLLAELFSGWSLNIIGGESSKHVLWLMKYESMALISKKHMVQSGDLMFTS